MFKDGKNSEPASLNTQEEAGLKEAGVEFTRFYKFSLWWVNNKQKYKRLAYGAAMAVEAVLLAFVIWTMIDSWLVSYPQEQRAVSEMAILGQAELHAYTLAHAAAPLSVGGTGVLPAASGRYDFYALVGNPNSEWWAEIEYRFATASQTTDAQKDFILPGQEKPLIVFASAEHQAGVPRSPSLEILSVKWNRVKRQEVGNYEAWYRERMTLEISDIAVNREIETGARPLNQVSFTVANQGAFSFYDPAFIVLLKRGTAIVGINRITLSSLKAGERQDVSVNWFETLPEVSRVEVLPDLNLFDSRIYQVLD